MEAAFHSDALDDLHGVDLFAPEPPLVDMPQHWAKNYERIRRNFCMLGFESEGSLDFGFLLVCNELAPELFGSLVAWRTGARPSTAVESYRHVAGARNALRYTLHQTDML